MEQADRVPADLGVLISMADEALRGAPDDSSEDPSFDWDALARYAAGESPAEERRTIESWLARHPRDAAMFASLNDVVAHQEGLPDLTAITIDVESALSGVKSRQREQRGDAKVIPLRGVGASRRRVWPRVVGLAAAAGLTVLAIKFRGPVGTPRATTARTYSTPVGTRDSVLLADGSRVVLAPGSRLETTAGFGNGAREVTLDGAAFFDVHHDAAAPFTVRAGGAVIRDIGTSFSVRTDGVIGGAAPSRDTAARDVIVAVTSGVVSLSARSTASDSGVRLAARDRAIVHVDGRVELERGGATEADTAWREGRLVYRDAPLETVRADLRRWYGLVLIASDSAVAQRRLTATFNGESPARVLEVIGLALGADMRRSGDTVILRRAAVAPR
jgi:transmembrane sensor